MKPSPRNNISFLSTSFPRFEGDFSGNFVFNYAKELYPLMYPSYAEKGLKGNVNVASFMYDYANFGWKGFILSGFLLGLLFVFIELLFRDHLILKLSLNNYLNRIDKYKLNLSEIYKWKLAINITDKKKTYLINFKKNEINFRIFFFLNTATT